MIRRKCSLKSKCSEEIGEEIHSLHLPKIRLRIIVMLKDIFFFVHSAKLLILQRRFFDLRCFTFRKDLQVSSVNVEY